jgi:hypothetical protein
MSDRSLQVCWLDDDIFTVEGLLTPEECLALIRRGEALGFEEATVALASGPAMVLRTDVFYAP